MKVIGFQRRSFKGDDGQQVSGVNVYLSYPLDKGEGQGAERVYLTDAKLAECGYTLKVGDEVNVWYNRYGKCTAIFPVK